MIILKFILTTADILEPDKNNHELQSKLHFLEVCVECSKQKETQPMQVLGI